MNPKDVIGYHQSSFLSSGQFVKGNEISRLRKVVHNCQNHSIALGGREASDKVQAKMGPGAGEDEQRPQLTKGRLVRSLVLGTNRASLHELYDIFG